MGRLDDSPVQKGDILAQKYRVERVLGVGGMGAVVAARHMDLDELRAVKVMLPRAVRVQETVERFMREARAVVRLKNPHVVKVYDVGRLDSGQPYMVMEYLEGRSLKAMLEAGPLPTSEVVDYVLQALEAVADAHAAGLVHRDLKPSNLFLSADPDGNPYVKVLDFGISKLTTEGGGEMTTTSDVLGSPFYMSPEQMRSTKDVDARADLWSVGVILYQLLGGKVPFVGETITQVCLSVVQDEPEPLSAVRSDLPPELVSVVMRCLEKELDRRYQDAAELARDLEAFGSERAAKSVKRIHRRLGIKLRPQRPALPRPAPARAVAPVTPSIPDRAGAGEAEQQRLKSLRRVSEFGDDDEPTVLQPSAAAEPKETGESAAASRSAAPAAAAGSSGSALAARRPVPRTVVMEDPEGEAGDADLPAGIQAARADLGAAPASPGGSPAPAEVADDDPEDLPTRIQGAQGKPPLTGAELRGLAAAASADMAGDDARPAPAGSPAAVPEPPAPSPAASASDVRASLASTTGDELAQAAALAAAGGPVAGSVAAGSTTSASWQQEGWPSADQLQGSRLKRRRALVMLGLPLVGAAFVAVALLALRGSRGESSEEAATGGTVAATEPSRVSSASAAGSAAAGVPAAMVEVPAGEYWIGCDPKVNDGCFDDEKPGRTVEVDAFFLMHHEVTVAEYDQCVRAGGCEEAGRGDQCTFRGKDMDVHPINCVTWEAARAYCQHRGWRLPTELEWEVAARGEDRRSYPWGNEAPTCDLTVMANRDGGGCGRGGPLAGGSKPRDVSWIKVFDLGGSVREWTASEYAPYVGGSIEEGASGRVNRGGSWMMDADAFNTSHTRGVDEPDESRPDLGFRCAADP